MNKAKQAQNTPLKLATLIGLMTLTPFACASIAPAHAQQSQSAPINTQPQQQYAPLTKEAAKQYGLIGELPNGLVGAVVKTPHPPELTELINHINKGRMIAYKAAAQKSHMPLGYVQLKAGDRLFQMVGPGHYYHKGGKWRMR
tara:strand:+ start:581785 stop:582213 length:429 start_codon:yes stop_codon:yes gene_type:complete